MNKYSRGQVIYYKNSFKGWNKGTYIRSHVNDLNGMTVHQFENNSGNLLTCDDDAIRADNPLKDELNQIYIATELIKKFNDAMAKGRTLTLPDREYKPPERIWQTAATTLMSLICPVCFASVPFNFECNNGKTAQENHVEYHKTVACDWYQDSEEIDDEAEDDSDEEDDEPELLWAHTQPICYPCWHEVNNEHQKSPSPSFGGLTNCAWCGKHNDHGVFQEIDHSSLPPYPSIKRPKESE